jgi:hypothetical protein
MRVNNELKCDFKSPVTKFKSALGYANTRLSNNQTT